MTKLAFAWPGLPDYAARCIRAVAQRRAESVSVVATRPSVPIEGMERSLGHAVHWLDEADAPVSWSSLNVSLPEILFCGGYGVPAFSALAREVRAAGGLVVLMSDNNWVGGLQQRMIEPLRHRLLFRKRFDAVFVPGSSGERVAQYWGYDNQLTATGLYGADPALFNGGVPLFERPKRFLYVGQFIPRKNVLGLADAFISIAERHPDWSLDLCGSGIQQPQIPAHARISVHGFVPPRQLAELLRRVRCLVLPSLEEHWGLVVHEAALSGCALLLTSSVGAAEDLVRQENGVLVRPGDTRSLAGALSDMANWDDARWAQAEAVSRDVGAKFGPTVFAAAVDALIARMHETRSI